MSGLEMFMSGCGPRSVLSPPLKNVPDIGIQEEANLSGI